MKRRRQNKKRKKKKKKKGGNNNQKNNQNNNKPEKVDSNEDFLSDFLNSASPLPEEKEEIEEIEETPETNKVVSHDMNKNEETVNKIKSGVVEEEEEEEEGEENKVEKNEELEEVEGEDNILPEEKTQKKSKSSSKMPYCRECGFPSEYCEFQSDFETRCKQVLQEDNPELYKKVMGIKKKEKRKAKRKNKNKTKGSQQSKVFITLLTRVGKKSNSRIEGLEMYGHELRTLSKELRKSFNCGVSEVEGEKASKTQKSVGDALLIQGDYVEDLEDMCLTKWNVPKSAIVHDERKLKGRKKRNVAGGGKGMAKRRAKTRAQADHDY